MILPEKALSTMFRSRHGTIKLASLSFVCCRFIESCCWPGACCSQVLISMQLCIYLHFCPELVTSLFFQGFSLNSTVGQPRHCNGALESARQS